MKYCLCLIFAIALTSSASVVDFALSPPGTDNAVGIMPQNEVPAVTNSSGSGGVIAPGIFLNTATWELGFAMGYGASAGFTDLTGVPTGMHFHAPAGPGTNAPVAINLLPFHLPAANPLSGGRILGIATLTTNQVADILNGLVYVNLHTALNPGGEIRAQLIPVSTNLPPALVCPTQTVAECSVPATLTAWVADPEADALSVVWTVNGAAIQTNAIPAGETNGPGSVSLTAVFPLGTNTIGITAVDSVGNESACATTLTVVDTTPPVIVSVSATPNVFWPPNHKMMPVQISAVVTDACTTATWKVVLITCNQPVNGLGDGNTSPDWQITGDHAVSLRSERSGKYGDRIYTIKIRATDLAGNHSTATTKVTVPKSQSKATPPVVTPPNSGSSNPGNSNSGGSSSGNSNSGSSNSGRSKGKGGRPTP